MKNTYLLLNNERCASQQTDDLKIPTIPAATTFFPARHGNFLYHEKICCQITARASKRTSDRYGYCDPNEVRKSPFGS